MLRIVYSYTHNCNVIWSAVCYCLLNLEEVVYLAYCIGASMHVGTGGLSVYILHGKSA